MVTSAKEALYHINHSEYLYEIGQISFSALETKLEYFVGILYQYDSLKADSERRRLNNKYGFSI